MLKANLFIVLTIVCISSFSQNRYFTKTGTIIFTSQAPMENIAAVNKTTLVVMDAKTGAIQFAVQMKGFEFEKQLMQDHFNENYVESDRFPRAEFKGSITNNSEINYSKDGNYAAKVKGKLTLHGITKDVDVTGTIKLASGKLLAHSKFSILLSDYGINIPSVVKDKLSNIVAIDIECATEPLKN
jgi:polyisoprenoid-binding protein YceI